MQFLKVSENTRYLTDANGTPFFWMGDTAWELFHVLNFVEATTYLDKRAQQGFNVIQAVALAELDGLNTPNANGHYPLIPDEDGSFTKAEPDLREESNYWTHVDAIFDLAEERGIYIAFLPTWGDKWNLNARIGPEFLNAENSYRYASFLANRYGQRPNLIWVLQGDRTLLTRRHHEVQAALVRGIRDHSDRRQLITAHPDGGTSSSKYFHEEEWLDFNMVQSGHSKVNEANYEMIAHDRALMPAKPTFDAEPCYEDHPIGFNAINGYFDDYDVRQACYWAVLAGGLGVTYGHHSVWAMKREATDYWPMTWQDALDRPGAWQMQHLRSLMESVDFQSGEPRQDLLLTPYEGANYTSVFAGEGFLLAYSPNGLAFELDLSGFRSASARWMNPRTGEYTMIEAATERFLPPSAGRNNDWVLVLTTG